MLNAHRVTREFESALCEYTGAKYAVAVNSCTMALLLALEWHIRVDRLISDQRVDMSKSPEVHIPKKTYLSVPQSIIHAGGLPVFNDVDWSGGYRLRPYPVWDYARRFTSYMYIPGQFQCVSFHTTKILGDTQGGAILHDNEEADSWLRRARFDGRTEGVPAGEDDIQQVGWHCYLSPDVSARLLWKLSTLPKHNDDLPNDDYPDLSKLKVFNV